MVKNSMIKVEIDESLKNKVDNILANIGLTVSDVIRITLTKIAEEKALPFELKPNKLTTKTLLKNNRGEDIYYAKDTIDLFNKLGIK